MYVRVGFPDIEISDADMAQPYEFFPLPVTPIFVIQIVGVKVTPKTCITLMILILYFRVPLHLITTCYITSMK